VRRDLASDPKPYDVNKMIHPSPVPRWPYEPVKAKILDVNQYWVTFECPEFEILTNESLVTVIKPEIKIKENGVKMRVSEPLSKITLNYNNEHKALELLIMF